MSHSFTHLLYHIVFATKHRRACLDEEIRDALFPVMGNLIRDEGGIPVCINGMPDHVHIFARLKQDRAVSDVIRAVKAGSSRWIHKTIPDLANMSWQTGYGAFTVSLSQSDTVREYIRDQQRHHAKMTYIDEFRALLKTHGFEVTDEELLRDD